jgi:hypothetical protein
MRKTRKLKGGPAELEKTGPSSQSRIMSIDAASADKLLDARDGDAALLFLYILRNGSHFSLRDAARRTGLSEESLPAPRSVFRVSDC